MPNGQQLKNLRRAIKCPHCWESFPPDDVRWTSVHSDLLGDPRLGDEANRRFTPTRFNVAGNAIDAYGSVCSELACPHCHLPIARPLLEIQPWFASIAGTPACGKSFFLTKKVLTDLTIFLTKQASVFRIQYLQQIIPGRYPKYDVDVKTIPIPISSFILI